jgi:hypothetical protein
VRIPPATRLLKRQRATLKGGEDALVRLTRERSWPWFPQRGTGSGRCFREEIVKALAGDHQQAVGRTGADDGEPSEGGVELIELVGS